MRVLRKHLVNADLNLIQNFQVCTKVHNSYEKGSKHDFLAYYVINVCCGFEFGQSGLNFK